MSDTITQTPALAATDEAAARLAELLSQEPEGSVLVVAVRPGGCSGFSWELYFDTDYPENSELVTLDSHDVTIAVEPSSAELIRGSTLTYAGGLSGAFGVTNPNAQRTCGCGQSFS